MHLTPRENERLLLFAAAELARRRLARDAPIGATEAVALVCDEICEWAWDGVPLAEVVERAGRLLGPADLLPGVAAAVPRIEVEALFPYGSVLVHVEAPFGTEPSVRPGGGEITLAPGRARTEIAIRNTGPRPVWVSSHYPLEQANRALEFDRAAAAGCRLDLPAGTAVEFAPGEERVVTMVPRS